MIRDMIPKVIGQTQAYRYRVVSCTCIIFKVLVHGSLKRTGEQQMWVGEGSGRR